MNLPKILVVEDEQKIADALRQGLAEHGYDVHVAYDGRLALKLFGADSFDLLIVDINLPGLNGYLEMRRWIDAGVTPRRLFVAATIANARAFGLERELGTIEPGKRANLLLLARDPLKSVEAWDSIETVIVGGRAVARAELSARAAGR